MQSEEHTNVGRRYRATGPEQVRQLLTMLRAAFPDATFTLDQQVLDDKGTVAYVWSARGTRSGEVAGYPATGAPARIVAVASVVTQPTDKPAPH
jgi:predicted ester cyclase